MSTIDPAKGSRTGGAGSSGVLIRMAMLCLGVAGVPFIAAAQSLDMDSESAKPAPAPAAAAPTIGGLDTDENGWRGEGRDHASGHEDRPGRAAVHPDRAGLHGNRVAEG
jgi:hypothetical protein